MIPDLRRYRFLLAAVLLAVAAACVLILAGRKFSADITGLLPPDSAAARMLRNLQEENLSGRMTVELRIKDGRPDAALLTRAVRQLETALHHPDITSVFTGLPLPDPELLARSYTALPRFATAADLEAVAAMITPAEIDLAIRRDYLRLAAPGGLALNRFIAADPLGFNRLVLKKLELFARLFQYRTDPASNLIIGADRCRALLALETAVPVTDSRRAAALLRFIAEQTGKLPDRISARVLCAHRHTLGNEKAIASDVLVVSLASLAVFTLLFALVYRRRPESLLIVLMPLGAILASVTVMALVMDQVSAFVAGLGGVMAGISVDYGIHVYARYGESGGDVRRLRSLIRPLAAGALTTMAVFVAFFFSGIETYAQLAVFAILSVTLSLAMALFVLPNLLPKRTAPAAFTLRTPVWNRRQAATVTGLWLLAAAVTAVPLLRAGRFDRSAASLDGSGPDVAAEEKDFNTYWNNGSMPALLLVSGSNRDAVLEQGEKLARLTAERKIDGFVSPTTLLPSARTMAERRDAWRHFWNHNRIERTVSTVILSGLNHGFRRDAFTSFNAWLKNTGRENDAPDPLIALLQEKLLRRNAHGDWTLTSFMADTPENFAAARLLRDRLPGLRIVSPVTLRDAIGTEVLGRLLKIGAAGLGIVLLLAMLATGGVLAGIIALLPVLLTALVLGGTAAAFGIPLSVPSCVAMIIVTGLSIDYGIFMVFRCFRDLREEVMTAVALSALTTAAGAAPLLFASHPVMSRLGVTLLAGIAVSFAAAATLIPALATLLKKKSPPNPTLLALPLLAAVLTLAGNGCAGLPPLPPPGPLLSTPAPRQYRPPDRRWRAVSSLTFEVRGHRETLLCAAEFDAVERSGSLVCLQPAGMKVLEAAFRRGEVTAAWVMPALAERGLRVRDVVRDLIRLSFDNRRETVSAEGAALDFDPATGMLRGKKSPGSGPRRWTIAFRQYKLIDGYSVPLEMRLEHFAPDYTLLIKIREFAVLPPPPTPQP